MVYLLLLVLGLIVLVQSYLLFSLMRTQQDLQKKVARLLRTKQRWKPEKRKTPTERGRTR
ncbi:hypothetical protein I588_01688 [Enterococcus pallens ATCC BAA-351]|uniref:Uncharacterized protein n=1 Tax=Enterococcus pallens ATCC BAA-351 TaxID=1158607 RepID=R2SR54_9ENTE|nr:hypothetical protein UAU_00408 [Enterococcus pallens ATCC BAA-351]EOU20841.1 hypothetical protein I588_01688 [Enterococcus pallens ATCC BAA-351]